MKSIRQQAMEEQQIIDGFSAKMDRNFMLLVLSSPLSERVESVEGLGSIFYFTGRYAKFSAGKEWPRQIQLSILF